MKNRQSVSSLCIIMLVILLSGCIQSMREPSPKLMSTWNYGPEPKDYKTIVLASPVLASKDVDNPRFEFQGAPKKTWIPHGTADFLYGWGGSVKRFGSKTGTMTYQYIIRNGNLIHITSANDSRLFKL